MMRCFIIALIALGLAVFPSAHSPALADKAPIYQSFLGTAIDGTDPVSYFTDERPLKGKSEFFHEWNGATWYFTTAENRDLFAANPENYAPQYGGYCAFAVAHGYTAKTEPEAFTVVDGKLYLNYDLSIKSRWDGDQKNFIKQAEVNWPKLSRQ